MFSIESQKKIMWIPLVNIVNIVTLPFRIRGLEIGTHAWWMLFAYAFGSFFVGFAFFRLVTMPFPQGSPIHFICNLYLFPVLMNYGLIKYQEKYLNL